MGNLTNYSHSFSAGTKAKASQVNTNFTEVQTAHNATDAELPTYTNGNRVIVSNAGQTGMTEATATTTEVNYLSGVTSAIQTQLDSKVDDPATETHGGTGKTAYTKGDILFSDALDSLAKLAIGTSGQVLTTSSGIPAWEDASSLKEYGLELSISDNVVTVAKGNRYDSDNTYAIELEDSIDIDLDASEELGLDTGSPSSETQYYIWLLYGSSGVTGVLSTSATSPTEPTGYDSYKACIGRIMTDDSSDIDPDQLWTKPPNGTETYKYEQLSGDFPYDTDVELSHNLGSTNVIVETYAIHNSSGVAYPLHCKVKATDIYSSANYILNDENTITVIDGDPNGGGGGYYFVIKNRGGSYYSIIYAGGYQTQGDFRLKVTVRTL